MDKLASTAITRALTSVRVFIKKPPNQIAVLHHNMLLPHELFAAMYHAHRDRFLQRIMGGSSDNVSRFWSEVRDHPAMCDHPVKDRDGL
jgi:hypothetical protein